MSRKLDDALENIKRLEDRLKRLTEDGYGMDEAIIKALKGFMHNSGTSYPSGYYCKSEFRNIMDTAIKEQVEKEVKLLVGEESFLDEIITRIKSKKSWIGIYFQ